MMNLTTTNLTTKSLPSLGAWIETVQRALKVGLVGRRSLHWERGLKHVRRRLGRIRRDVAPFTGSVD